MKFQIIAGELCLDFINTLDNRPVPQRRQDLVPNYFDLLEWALQAGGVSRGRYADLRRAAESHPGEAAAVRRRAVELRECLYRIVSATIRKRRLPEEDLGIFSGFLAQALSHQELRPTPRGYRLELAQSPRLDSILWAIALSAGNLLTGADLKHVRECGVGTCRWLFVDRSKNHSRRWCDMKLCGNRIKARKFYRRRAGSKNVT